MAITREFSGRSEKQTATAFNTTNTSNVSDDFCLADYINISFQLVFAAITGTQPAVELQKSNDGTNWDNTGITHTTTAAAESTTKDIIGAVGSMYRWKVTTASTTGTCVVTAVGNGRG